MNGGGMFRCHRRSQRLEKPQSAMGRHHGRGRSFCRGEGTAAMMGTKLRTFAPQIDLSLEESVPKDHFYRYLDQQLDLSFVSTFVEPRYAQEDCPSIDPVVFFKLQLDLSQSNGE
jgi:hypothetical protein